MYSYSGLCCFLQRAFYYFSTFDVMNVECDNMTESWYNPAWHLYPKAEIFYEITNQLPTHHQSISNQSPTSCRPIAADLQPISNQWQQVTNQSLTGRWPVTDFYGQFSPTNRQLDGDWLPIDLQWKSGGFDHTMVAADFWSQSSHWQVAIHVWPELYQYKKFHCGDKTVVKSSYLRNAISPSGKMASMASLYWTNP